MLQTLAFSLKFIIGVLDCAWQQVIAALHMSTKQQNPPL